MTQVKIVGSEAICASGLNKKHIFESCLQQKSFVLENGLAPISQADWAWLRSETGNSSDKISNCLVASAFTLRQALKESGWSATDLKECGFIFATTTSQIDQWQNSLPFCDKQKLSFEEINFATRYQSLGLTLIQLQEEFQILGPSSVVASSCSASLQALALGSLWIQTGKVKRCLVGSTEILSDLTVSGFGSLRLLTKGPCKPFSAGRAGINLGEASAFICLEAANLSEKEGQGYLTGIGLSSDAYHPTSPQPEGEGSARAMKMALDRAGLGFSDIDWLHAHGTGSAANDLAESKAILSVAGLKKCVTPVSSTKSIHGHTLGTCGALETIIALTALQQQVIIPTFNTGDIDALIQLNIVQAPLQTSIKHILKNSLGFGGINASIVISKVAGVT